ncbi:hypothetical protein BU26DRAFT_566857 [Trematosphaeria pertusa]|uniref:Uncharacterized protein n=1 Tax=Trematosphaeria pertusa TaxID=390896 RepID=A0A6A6I877_9PLEO|nr:uncharacterized protein BU26DRAFT_566857 [Trematosphaeria pertusa]KAF2246487.1 hypothetical protein BU26DRAFT_566857 [Trematosphaeria pertusa]
MSDPAGSASARKVPVPPSLLPGTINAATSLVLPLPGIATSPTPASTTSPGHRTRWYTGYLQHWPSFSTDAHSFYADPDFRVAIKATNTVAIVRLMDVAPGIAVAAQSPDEIADVYDKKCVKVVEKIAKLLIAAFAAAQGAGQQAAVQELGLLDMHTASWEKVENMKWDVSWRPRWVLRTKNTEPGVLGGGYDTRVVGHFLKVPGGAEEDFLSAAIADRNSWKWKSLRCVLGRIVHYLIQSNTAFGFITTYHETVFLRLQIITHPDSTRRGVVRLPKLYYSDPIRSSTTHSLASPVHIAAARDVFAELAGQNDMPFEPKQSAEEAAAEKVASDVNERLAEMQMDDEAAQQAVKEEEKAGGEDEMDIDPKEEIPIDPIIWDLLNSPTPPDSTAGAEGETDPDHTSFPGLASSSPPQSSTHPNKGEENDHNSPPPAYTRFLRSPPPVPNEEEGIDNFTLPLRFLRSPSPTTLLRARLLKTAPKHPATIRGAELAAYRPLLVNPLSQQLSVRAAMLYGFWLGMQPEGWKLLDAGKGERIGKANKYTKLQRSGEDLDVGKGLFKRKDSAH